MDRANSRTRINARFARFPGVSIWYSPAPMCDRCSILVHFPHLFLYYRAVGFIAAKRKGSRDEKEGSKTSIKGNAH